MSGKNHTFLGIAIRVVVLQFKASKTLTVINFVTSMLHALMWVSCIFATQLLFDAILHGAELGFRSCLKPLLMLAGVSIGQQVMSGVWNFVSNGVMYDKTLGYTSALLHSKLLRIEA